MQFQYSTIFGLGSGALRNFLWFFLTLYDLVSAADHVQRSKNVGIFYKSGLSTGFVNLYQPLNT